MEIKEEGAAEVVEVAGATETQVEKKPRRRKKLIAVVVVLVLICSLAGNVFQLVKYFDLNKEVENLNGLYSVSYFYFNSLTVSAFKEKVAAGDDFIVLIERPNCSDCSKMEEPFINLTEKLGISNKIYILNVVLLRRDADAWAKFKEIYEFPGTPSYVRFSGGENISSVVWTEEDDITMERIETWIREQGDYFGF